MAKRQQVRDFNPYKALQPTQQVTDQYVSPGYFQMPQNEWADVARSLSGLSETMSEVAGNMQRAEVEAEIQQGTAQVDLMTEDQLDAALALQWRQAGLPEGASPLAQKSILSHAGSKKARHALEQFRITNLDRFADPYSTEDPRAAMQQAFEQLGISGFYAGNAASAVFSNQANAFSEQVYQARAARTAKLNRENLADDIYEAATTFTDAKTPSEMGEIRNNIVRMIEIGHEKFGFSGRDEAWRGIAAAATELAKDDLTTATNMLNELEGISINGRTLAKQFGPELDALRDQLPELADSKIESGF